jgi:Flp pilus assembly protein TadG
MPITKNRQSGSAIVMVMLFFVPMLAMVGLVVDVGSAYFARRAAQTAADAAASAAAQAALDGINSGGAYTCGSKGLGCQGATACPATITTPTTTNLQNGCLYATANGFTNGGLNGKQTVTLEANITTPAPTVSGVLVKYWVTARISQTNPLTFIGILRLQSTTVNVIATAGIIAAQPNNCITVLDPAAQHALVMSGSAQIDASCGVAVNSTNSDALDISGGACLIANSIQVVGGAHVTACTNPTPTTNATAVSDPLVNLVTPSFNPLACDHLFYSVSSGSHTLSPGTYCGGITFSGGSGTFNSGTYILLGGGFVLSGGASVSGTGVTFYNTFNFFYPYHSVQISGGSTANLTAPSSGSLSGILFFGDRTASTSAKEQISGGSSAVFTGTLYFPVTELDYSGGSSSNAGYTIIVADKVDFSSSCSLTANPSSSTGPPVTKTALIQ